MRKCSIFLLQVLAHETCHVFYLAHCVFYDCLMNESSSVTEAINQPLFLCPICIRKLQKVCKFDILKRYTSMLDFLISINTDQSSVHLNNSIDWLQKFLQWGNKQERTWWEINSIYTLQGKYANSRKYLSRTRSRISVTHYLASPKLTVYFYKAYFWKPFL